MKTITIPDLGGAAQVTVIEILVKVGDNIEVDAPIVTLESDKATMEIPASDAGVVKTLQVKVGDTLSSGSAILTLEAAGAAADKSAKKSQSTDKKPEKKTEQVVAVAKPKEEVAAKEPLTGSLQTDADIHAGPGVRRMARELGVNLALLQGSGPKSRIIKEDVQAYVKTQLTQMPVAGHGLSFAALPAIDFNQFGATDCEPLSRIQKISGKNLQRNWVMIPHVTQFGQADITSLEAFRQSQKSDMEKQKVKLTPLVFIMKAVVASLKAFPHFNASIDASGERLVIKHYYNVGVAVDTPEGLVVPVVRQVDKKGLVELAQELGQVSEKARKKQLTPGDMQGGCFSISSLGGIGGTAFTPIINSPEVAILGVSTSSYQPVYQEGNFVPRLMLPLSLSYDHRVIDGADGARFMMHLTNLLSDIRNLLL